MADDQRRRRKDAGKRIQRARRAAGHRSQASFADAIGYHESSVAQAESGSDRAGGGLFQAIEDALHMPPMVISTYIETGDETLLERLHYGSAEDVAAEQPAKSTVSDQTLNGEDQRLMKEVLHLIGVHGVDKVTAAVIAAVREHDLEARKQAGQSETDGDQSHPFE